ncbi:MAG: cytochrome P450 [Amylibacter sp.]
MDFLLTDLPDGFHNNPYKTYVALRQDAPVHPQPDGSFVISRHADLDMIYRDTRRFISDKKTVFKPKYGDSLLFEHHTTSLVFNDAPLHTRVRSIMVGAMNPRAIAGMEQGLIAQVTWLLDQMEHKGEVDLVSAFAGAIPIEVIGNLFDMPHEERGPLRDWSLAILGALEPALTQDQLDDGNRAVAEFKAYLKDLVARREQNPGNPETDVLTRMMQSEQGQLSEVELLQNCIFILNAGHETTTNLIGNALALLDGNPVAKAALISNPTLLNTAVDEFLRMESPNQFGNRLTTENMEMHGVHIPAGSDLHLCIGAANRDETKFENAEVLQLDRRPNKHLAFAGGPHTCVGLSLARMEGRVAVGRFLERFPNYSLSDGAERGNRIRFRGYARLPAKLI